MQLGQPQLRLANQNLTLVVYVTSDAANHRSVLNILDSLLANQTPAEGVVTIVCRVEIRKMAEC